MIYLATSNSPAIRAHMERGPLGMLTTPQDGRSPARAHRWAADNGCFGNGYPGDEAWLAWLRTHSAHAARCLFATAPDVVGDAAATLERSTPHLPTIRAVGYPAAFVAQDGAETVGVPWDDFDALFLGGSTAWKLSPSAARLVAEAKARGKWAHMGRVNSWRRWQIAEAFGCDSADGTFLTYGPDLLLPVVLGWAAQDALPLEVTP